MTDTAPSIPQKKPGGWRAALLALIVHAGLLALLWFGIRWQSDTPIAVEAEIWSPQTRAAAPKREIAEPPVTAAEKPPVKTEPQRTTTPTAPKEEAKLPDPEIALAQQKKRQQERKKALELKQEELDEKKLREQQQRDKKLAQRAEQQHEEAAKKEAAAELARQRTLKDETQRKRDSTDARRIAQQRENELRRLTEGVGQPDSTGDAPRAQGTQADANYVQKVAAKIKSNTVFNVAEELNGNPAVEYAVELLPDGSIRSLRRLKTSGIAGFDDAVKRAIEKSQPYPPDKSGAVPSGFNLIHKPKDQ